MSVKDILLKLYPVWNLPFSNIAGPLEREVPAGAHLGKASDQISRKRLSRKARPEIIKRENYLFYQTIASAGPSGSIVPGPRGPEASVLSRRLPTQPWTICLSPGAQGPEIGKGQRSSARRESRLCFHLCMPLDRGAAQTRICTLEPSNDRRQVNPPSPRRPPHEKMDSPGIWMRRFPRSRQPGRRPVTANKRFGSSPWQQQPSRPVPAPAPVRPPPRPPVGGALPHPPSSA